MRGAAAVLLAAAMAITACRGARRVEQPGGRPQAKPEEPDAPAEKGVPPAAGRPRVPSSPEALLAEGAVADIQEALARRELLKEHRRGELDAATSAAIRRFQRDEKLAETGFPDRETLTRLGIDPEKAYGRAGDKPR